MRLPAAGAESLRGERPFLFLRKKKRSFTPKKKKAGLRGINAKKTAACVFTHCLGTSPGRYGHPMVEQGWFLVLSCGRLVLPLSGPGWSGASLAAEGEELASDLPEALRPTRGGELHAARGLLPHSAARVAPAGGGWLERRSVPVPQRQAVTAGRGPPCYTKAASRRSQPQTLRRPGPLFLWSQGPFLFPQKKKWTLPLPGRHPPEGLRPCRAGTPGGAPSKFSIASKYQIGYNSRRR